MAGEALLWCARPHDRDAVRSRTTLIVVIAAAAIVMRMIPGESALATTAQANAIFLAILVIALIGEAMTFHTRLASTFYGVTNQRVIIVWGLREHDFAGVPLGLIAAGKTILRRRGDNLELRDPSPESFFDTSYIPFTNPSAPPRWAGQARTYRLIGVTEAGRIYGLIMDTAAQRT
ncbi:MAG TPA: hypothetical protein VMU16_02510 [Candidatus Binataceae bacterium]|nr:hypothetical protein [Candidatus Binataceae bacterium]